MSDQEPTPFQKMQELAVKVLSVPKSEIDRREKAWKESKTPPTPKTGDGEGKES